MFTDVEKHWTPNTCQQQLYYCFYCFLLLLEQTMPDTSEKPLWKLVAITLQKSEDKCITIDEIADEYNNKLIILEVFFTFS